MKWLPIFFTVLLLTGCSTLPFEAGQIKREQPYPEGEWVGPVTLGEAEHAIREGSRDGTHLSEWAFNDVDAAWEKLKKKARPGDEVWEFRLGPFVVDGGNRYSGFSLVRGKMIIASVVTGVIAVQAP